MHSLLYEVVHSKSIYMQDQLRERSDKDANQKNYVKLIVLSLVLIRLIQNIMVGATKADTNYCLINQKLQEHKNESLESLTMAVESKITKVLNIYA